jgi:hypothetical protein
MKNYYDNFQKVVNRGKQAAQPAKSRTMKGRVQDEKEKQDKIAKNKDNMKKVGQVASNVVQALGGIGSQILGNKELTGKVGQALGGVGSILFRKRRRRYGIENKRKLSEIQVKGGGNSGTRVR